MTGDTIKTLAEYVSELRRENTDFFKDYEKHPFDSNGVEVDHVENICPSDTRSEVNK